MRPLRAQIAYFLNGCGRGDGQFVVVAAHYPSALRLQILNAINDLDRLPAVTHHITQECKLLSPLRPRVREACLQGVQIAMDVGEQCQFHDQRVRLE